MFGSIDIICVTIIVWCITIIVVTLVRRKDK